MYQYTLSHNHRHLINDHPLQGQPHTGQVGFREDASAAATFGDSEMLTVDIDETLTEEERGVAQFWALEEV